MSTPSVMEAVNEVLCETRQVISNAMHLIPCAKTPPETYSPLLCSGQGLEHIESDTNPALESSEVPQVGIVRQQRAVLEGLQPPRCSAAALPSSISTDRKPPTGDSTGRSKKEQARIIKELGSTMLPSVPGDCPTFCGSNTTTDQQQQPADDESAGGVVKRLTKELEAKARNEGRPVGLNAQPAVPAPPTPSRCTSLDADRLRKLSATRSLTALLARAPRAGEPPPSAMVTATPTVALIATMPAPAPVSNTTAALPGGLQRKVRKQQGKTHPLSKLTVRQRHANPLYNTM
ncbi:hypothetical protein MRX96_019723 [Rhipicephalus microplus]